jgi:acetylglutamate kinase
VRAGRRIVLVHGGGPEVTQRAEELHLATERRDGQRVTGDAMLTVVVEVLAGRVNVRIANALSGAGVPAVGLSATSGHLLRVVPGGDPPGSLGWVGRPVGVHRRLLDRLLDDGFTPVIAPLARDEQGQVYNVNADLAAAALAASLGADLSLVTDVPSVRDAAGRPIPHLTETAARRLIDHGVATDGMIPKLRAAHLALLGGAASAWIGDWAGLLADPASHGTRLTAGPAPARAASLSTPLRGGS